jgi:hypothetical protein
LREEYTFCVEQPEIYHKSANDGEVAKVKKEKKKKAPVDRILNAECGKVGVGQCHQHCTVNPTGAKRLFVNRESVRSYPLKHVRFVPTGHICKIFIASLLG